MFYKGFEHFIKVKFFLLYLLAYMQLVAAKSNPCFPIHTISFASLDSYLYHTDEEVELIYFTFPFISTQIQPYLNQCMNAQDITTLLKSLNDSVIKKGYLTTRFGIDDILPTHKCRGF